MQAFLFLIFVIAAAILVPVVGTATGLYDELFSMFRLLVWPTVVVSGFLFFRKVFTYLFLSMETFNFFGTKGRLKNVNDVISERVEERFLRERREREARQKIRELEESIRRLKERTKNKDRIVELSSELVAENMELWDLVRDKESELTLLREEYAAKDADASSHDKRQSLAEDVRDINERLKRLEKAE